MNSMLTKKPTVKPTNERTDDLGRKTNLKVENIMSEKKIKARMTRSRDYSAFMEFRHGSKVLLDFALEEPNGHAYLYLSTNMMLAFSFEALLNQVGYLTIPFWEEVEMLGWQKKFSILCTNLELDINPGIRPLQTVVEAFAARNEVAHGKPKKLSSIGVEETGTIEELRRRKLLTKWEQFATRENSQRLAADVEQLADTLFDAAGLDRRRLPRGAGYSVDEIIE